ncbi:SET domain containing protein [Leishmania donovani]|uniref:SET_domain_containing_protein_putative/Pfam:PF008 56 n=1 Tax=Leishmania donovani TaxID=5661 RepID=A0A6J8F547_LEIDO|nr:SET domain containing protein [Leishmania donovani]VDZ42553.1 SET_domain_containing_protein_putative/Pfam:PF00856 [Leishmania donovani]
MPPPSTLHRGSEWLSQCMRDIKAAKLQQTVRPYSNGTPAGEALPVRTIVATSRIHRGEHLGTVKCNSIMTGERASQLLRRACRGEPSQTDATAATGLQPLAAQRFDDLVSRISSLPSAVSVPPHLLLSRDALLVTVALYLTRSPLNAGVLPAESPLRAWADALPRRPPPMGALLRSSFLSHDNVEPLPRRLRLGQRTKEVAPGEDVAAASTELMVQAVEQGELELADLRRPEMETALTPTVLTNYFKGRMSALTQRQRQSQRARGGVAEAEEGALHLFMTWERQLQTHFVDALLPVLLLPSCGSCASNLEAVQDSAAWLGEESALRWAHFMTRSRAVNLNWRRPGPPQLSIVPLVDMLNHTSRANANVVYQREDSGDVCVTASRTIEAGEELVLRYNHIGQRGCLFGDLPRPSKPTAEHERGRLSGKAAAVADEVHRIEKRQYWELYACDEDEEAAQQTGHTPSTSFRASTRCGTFDPASPTAVGQQEMEQEVQWLWRFGFLRSNEEKNREAALLWSRSLRSRIAHLTDVRRKGRPGEFVVGVPEGLQHLREQREQLERDRYKSKKVFPPQQL